MRITGTNAASLSASPSAARRAGAGGTFSLSQFEQPSTPAPTTALRSVAGLDSLLALQGVEDPTEKKKRAVARGRKALDVLDELKLGMIGGGSLDTATIARLKVAAEGLTDGSGDSGLDGVLAEIDLRVAVELAKVARR
ncbi:flagellar assembly protein FliX [Undibacter mobilis]|uniref:Flagellar assembly regulator FliX n=1 Tax=Undibacter mobilis TaxID=2292256 RepID=A0A371BC99_9BRAD|nr:flagellar assembly protein FliX [Undibacter mobilis]RDV05188.1 flagellar assembly regulator FliX [Undibacter mobilis]